MLRLARVSSDSLVYDLGCGDGRLVVSAARNFGARGIGIDIDPQRIRESNENASSAHVTDRVKFVLGDLFQFDLREATAVTLYLLPDLNVKLRPALMSQLKPGTPVVSHDFDMGDWMPDEVKTVQAEARPHMVFLWIVPAQVAGVWQWTMVEPGTNDRYALMLRQQFQKVTGALTINGKESTIVNLKLEGGKIWFDTAFNHFEGQVDGERITLRTMHNGKEAPPITATRVQAGVAAAN
jgi:SAM-dependent methyltransferase